MKEINIEKIMEEIRADIKEKYGEEAVSFETVKQEAVILETHNMAAFREDLYHANMNYAMEYYFPLPGGIKGMVKKIIRKLGAFLGIPLTKKQTDYNAMMVRMFNQMNNYINYQEARNKELEQMLEGLEERTAKIERIEQRGAEK